ncbi:MAG TPA: response regulator [Polyangiaceae bacterium]|nr:response regulator [Polyangiaceae bacterium]
MGAAPVFATQPAEVVLVVEDDVSVREAIADVLADEGFDVVTVNDGRQALDYLAAHGAPCLILLDLYMPVMGGEEFRDVQLKDERFAGIPVVVISAAHDGRQRAARLAAADYLQKPIALDALLDVVSTYC